MMKILTVIVPSYNMETYLRQCLDCLVVKPNLMPYLEVVVVNDGSKDKTSMIAHEFAEKWSDTFCVIDKANGHYGSCINAALAMATGKYVKVLDADDSFDTSAFADYLKMLLQLGNVDLVTSDYVIVDETGKVTQTVRLPYPAEGVFGMDVLAKSRHELLMHGVAYRTSLLRDMGYRQTEGCVFTDTEWMFAPMLQVKTIVRYPRPLYRYLVGREGQSVSPGQAVRLLPAQLKVFGNIRAVYREKCASVAPAYREYMEIYLSRIYRIILVVYFLYAPLRRLREEFVGLHEEVAGEMPECVALTGNFGTIFAGRPFAIRCASRWQKTHNAFWVWLYRVYFYLRNPKRLKILFA